MQVTTRARQDSSHVCRECVSPWTGYVMDLKTVVSMTEVTKRTALVKVSNTLNSPLTLSPPFILSSAKFLVCFNFESASVSLKIGENIV